MIRTLLLCAMLFQATPQTDPKPAIDNDRVTVWEVTGHATVQPLDAVVVSLSGNAAFVPKGTTPNAPGDSSTGRSIVIDLKDHPVAPIANTSATRWRCRGPARRKF